MQSAPLAAQRLQAIVLGGCQGRTPTNSNDRCNGGSADILVPKGLAQLFSIRVSPWSTFRYPPWRRPLPPRCDPTRCRQRCSRPHNEFIRFVEQPLRRSPKGEVDGAAFLLIAEGRQGLNFLEDRPVVSINPEVECVVRHHPQHQP